VKYDQPVKLLLSYDIPQDLQQSYYSFVTGEFVPQANSIGLELAEVWETVYGDYPQRLIVFVAQDAQTAYQAINSDRFKRMEKKLRRFVENYSRRVVKYRSHFQF
jgi:protein involved in sex pheromone biosynthesis